jgi:hypothetical protein
MLVLGVLVEGVGHVVHRPLHVDDRVLQQALRVVRHRADPLADDGQVPVLLARLQRVVQVDVQLDDGLQVRPARLVPPDLVLGDVHILQPL